MTIPVLVEPITGSRYRARAGEPWQASAEAGTREEAVLQVQNLVQARLEAGARMMLIQIDVANPWLSVAGTLPSDQTTAAWEDAMQEYRDQVDRQELIS